VSQKYRIFVAESKAIESIIEKSDKATNTITSESHACSSSLTACPQAEKLGGR
jgi:hypothetical protein